MGVEPTPSAWEADVLPIYYICKNVISRKHGTFHLTKVIIAQSPGLWQLFFYVFWKFFRAGKMLSFLYIFFILGQYCFYESPCTTTAPRSVLWFLCTKTETAVRQTACSCGLCASSKSPPGFYGWWCGWPHGGLDRKYHINPYFPIDIGERCLYTIKY